jgi:hypothetical protein
MSRGAETDEGFIAHGLLSAVGVEHGFGTRQAAEPPDLVRPRQVHGIGVARLGAGGGLDRDEADAVVSDRPGAGVGIVTADCVPVLLASSSGRAVAAIHAGWRGLAAGVVQSGLDALRERTAPGEPIVAVIGPHIGRCCYEVDPPVMDPLRARFGSDLDAASAFSRAGHHWLDLGQLVSTDLVRQGVERDLLGVLPDFCTACGVARFHSYRREGAGAGRLLHYIRSIPLDLGPSPSEGETRAESA